MATIIAFHKFEFSMLLAGMILLPVFYALAIVNFVAIFVLWKRHRFHAFFPAITYVFSTLLCFFGTFAGSAIMLAGTPGRPDTFLNGQAKLDLEKVANRLLGQSFKEILTHPESLTEIHMVSGYQQKEVPPDILKTLQHYGFQRIFIDDSQSLVKFGHYHLRIWYEYIYTTNDFLPLYSRPQKITEVDIEDWSELLRIAKQGDHATKEEKERLVFTPPIVYPYLERELGKEFLQCVANYNSPADITAEQKELVLAVLNRQRISSSRLIEHPLITFERNHSFSSLKLDECHISDSFWVSSLIKSLLNEGVLVYADDGRHLKIKENLSQAEQLKIEWIHIGLMNFLYGNLLHKMEHHYDKVLCDGWYFNRW
jgi:hypothetical protein